MTLDLEDQIKAAKDKAPKPAPDIQPKDPMAGMGIGLHLVVAIFICSAIGYFLDTVLATKPIFLIIFLILGVASGFYSVYKASKGL